MCLVGCVLCSLASLSTVCSQDSCCWRWEVPTRQRLHPLLHPKTSHAQFYSTPGLHENDVRPWHGFLRPTVASRSAADRGSGWRPVRGRSPSFVVRPSKPDHAPSSLSSVDLV
ncbi:uncharacterized protein LY79DRAFT_225165 [Colletotrichum navitas]|uniref:Secreted protein n=1 Tax=Colletotrichum navitas TaxID=681940 RepID=A0AAD8V4E8_9PEZI|nr:uncharacterized protein LY79DRAFT_225165 [Colletotrichum navitas]KAK1590221.1 hypothetical protein LY79DRAFT_225165 [Colletotrichum navitas]